MAYGQNGHLGISFQSSLGTSNVNSMEYFPFVSETLTEAIEDLLSESLTSRMDEPDSYEGMHTIEGDVVFEVHPHLVGKLLRAAMGQSSQDVFVGSAYNHIFVPVDSDFTEAVAALPPMTIEVHRDTGSSYLYYDIMANQLALEVVQGAFYKMTVSMIGGQFAWAAKSTPSFNQSSFYTWDTSSVELGGVAITNVSQATITINNNLAGKAFLDGNKYHGRILRDGFRTVEVAGTMLLEANAQSVIYKNRTQQRFMLTATDPTTMMNAHNQLKIDIPKMLYTAFPANIPGPGLLEVGFTAKGKFDTTSNYAIQATVVNTTAVYQ